jgi:curved DNA-binding protein CbpA
MSQRTLTTAFSDYYSVLGVASTASAAEIRVSFKRLVLECHPDKNPGRREWSERRVRELIEAYDVLGHPQTREEFDRRRETALRTRRGVKGASRRGTEPWYSTRKDPEARAMLILQYLLQGKASAASRLVDELEARLGKGFLRENLDRSDYLDCLFLLAEFHLGRRQFAAALDRLRAFYRLERESRFPRHYLGQVVEMLKDLYLRKLPRWAAADAALAGLREVTTLGLSRSEEALRVRRIVEVLLHLGRIDEARDAVDAADESVLWGRDRERMEKLVGAAGRRQARSL